MTAHYMLSGVRRRVLLISPEDMDKLLAGKAGGVEGFPAYFDMNKRLWPKPASGVTVEFDT